MKKLIEGLHRFQTNYFDTHKDLFEELSHGQQPRVLFITCSDSRIDPNLITQANIGELFVIRNAGNIIPPFGATNGGEGASIEYAITALDIEQIIVCGHSHCGAMKGLLKMSKLADKMPLVYEWLKQAEATRRLIIENYSHVPEEDLLNITIAENVLTQLENLNTYPIIRSRLHQGRLSLHGWIYSIESGEILTYDPVVHDFVDVESRKNDPEYLYNLHPSCSVTKSIGCKIYPMVKDETPSELTTENINIHLPKSNRLSKEQAERIYRGSSS
ncbi:MAG: carbonic anhydrase [Cyanobacteria bacterium]|nr:carbonic anhydrase [Cyanobacteria bacterium CG_2015-16_32_12]NCO78791.1 carbonic anhydrase [Cyanobacteria bacterium CG_2015-22_32_23]NCQ04703.1 carbonic anhydrase [Cyanobacteria bacterium CG_2015-09_32_10]NCQ40343.1 carbonic anhydrase [Cyanobacteria bacterium CG_2015-04_32_10]NCS86098.1 carbonic anhydrase [Cyanobacteria bacterium CG_2015-02_32_10]